MSTTLKNRVYAVGTTAEEIVSTGSVTTTVLGLDLCNTGLSDLTVNCWITDTGTDYYLFKDLEVPAGVTAQPLSDVQRVVINSDQTLNIEASAGTSDLHVVLSMGETA